MQKLIALKVAVIFLLALVLLIPLWLIEDKIKERKSLQLGVTQSIADSSAGSQRLMGPLLVVNYTESLKIREKDVATGKEVERIQVTPGQQIILPDTLKVKGKAGVETRYRGIYSARIYDLDSSFSGSFVVPKRFGLGEDTATRTVRITDTFVSLGISDVRGIREAPKLEWNDQEIAFTESAKLSILDAGINAPLTNVNEEKQYTFRFDLKLIGTENLSVVPTGKTTTANLDSSWPHPSFYGRFLPRKPSVRENGFSAEWQTSHLATNMPTQIQRAMETRAGNNNGPAYFEGFDVSFLDPVNVYLQAERAVKYGILFVVLTFVAFFLLEILQRLQIHAMQYLFVGLALAVFFLLLISLSEHLSFARAYLIAAAVCTLLQGFYVSHVLRSSRRGVMFAGVLALLYGFMYMLLQSEDMAFLLGSVLMFGALALVMIFTRKVDWYRLPARTPLQGGAE